MSAPFPAITRDLFFAHYASAPPAEFDALLASHGITMTRKQIWQFASRFQLIRRAAVADDWEEDIRDSSAAFAGLPHYRRREKPARERQPWVCITKRYPDPKVEARRMR